MPAFSARRGAARTRVIHEDAHDDARMQRSFNHRSAPPTKELGETAQRMMSPRAALLFAARKPRAAAGFARRRRTEPLPGARAPPRRHRRSAPLTRLTRRIFAPAG